MFRKPKPTSVTGSNLSMVSENNQQGLAVLYEPSDNLDPPSFSIILVHGAAGSFLRSWTAENGCCWPRDLLPEDIGQLPLNGRTGRVLSWGYDAGLLSVGFSRSPSTATIHAHARGLLADVNHYRDQRTIVNHKIIFIGHGTGGIIIQAALCESMMGTDNLYRNVAGILFMGTPHRGLELARTVSIMGSIVSGVGLGSKSPILKHLKPNSEVLQNVNMQFRRVLQRAPTGICSAFETRKTPSFGLIVDQPAATFGLAEEITLPLDADHRHLSKFLDNNDINYIRVFGLLQQWIKQIIEEDLHRENPMAEPAPKIDAVEIDEGIRNAKPQTPTNNNDNGSLVVQKWDGTTDNPPRWEPRAEDVAAMGPSQPFERTKVSNLRPWNPPRSFGSNSTTTEDGMNTISTVASSVSSDSHYDAHNRSAAGGTGVIKGLEAAASTTANATTPAPSTIITGVGAGIAGTALGVQVITARQTLATARNAATASESSANTAKDAFALNQQIFDYNKSKDQAAMVSKPKPPPNDGASPPSAGQVLELKDEMFPSLANVSLTFAGPSKKKDDGDQDGHWDGDYHHPTTGIENQPDIDQHQLGKENGRGKGKEIEKRVPKPSSAQRTLFDHGFKSSKPNFSTPGSGMSTSNNFTGIGGSDSGKIQTPGVLPSDDFGAVLVQQGDIVTSIATEENETQNNGGEIIDDAPKIGPEEDPAETITSEPSTETSTKNNILLAVVSDIPEEYRNSSLDPGHPAVVNVQLETATSDTIDKESRPAEQEIPIATESAVEHSTAGRDSEPALPFLSPIDESVDQSCVSPAKSTLEATENDEKGFPVPRLMESSKAVELTAISQSSHSKDYKLVSTTLPDWIVGSGEGGSGTPENGLITEDSQDHIGKLDHDEGL